MQKDLHLRFNLICKGVPILICLFLWNQVAWAYPAYPSTLRPLAAAETFKDMADSKSPSEEMSPKDAKAFIRKITASAEIQERFNLNKPRYTREFYSVDVREAVYYGLLRPYGKLGILKSMIYGKRTAEKKIIRAWLSGCSTGEELRTMAWLVRKALLACGEDIKEWKLQFYGTDKIKNLIIEARDREGKPDKIFKTADRKDYGTVTVDTSGFDIKYFILDDSNMEHLDNWVAWQKDEGYFDIAMLHDEPADEEAEERIKSLIRVKGYYIAGNKLYKKEAAARFDEVKGVYITKEGIKPLIITAEPVQTYYWLRFVLDKRPYTLVIFDKGRKLKISIEDVVNRKIDNHNWLFWAMREGFIGKVYWFSPKKKLYYELTISSQGQVYSIKVKGKPVSKLPREELPEEKETKKLLVLVNYMFFTESDELPYEKSINDIMKFFNAYRHFLKSAILCHSVPDYADELTFDKQSEILERTLRPHVCYQ